MEKQLNQKKATNTLPAVQDISTEKNDIGLVLAGGGTKGVYEIGAWKALEECGVMDRFTGFSGSSIGAFNTALFVNGSLTDAVRLWESLTMADFADINADLIRERIEEGKGHTPAEAFEQNIRVRYASRKLAEKATDTAFGFISSQAGKLSHALDKFTDTALPEFSDSGDNSRSRHTDGGTEDDNSAVAGDSAFTGADGPNPSGSSENSVSAAEHPLSYNRHTARNFWIWCLQNLFGCGYALPDRLRAHLQQLLPADFCCPPSVEAFSTVCEWDAEKSCGGQACYISWKGRNLQKILDLIIASASLPVFYPSIEINGKTFVDGGYADNEPIQPLYDAGYRKILIIYLDKYKGKKLKNIIKEQERAYPGCEFLRLFPNDRFNDSFTKSCMISAKLTEERMLAGYEDGLKLFRRNPFFET